jgi:hypothetical protein
LCLFCLFSTCVLCTQCCQCFWIDVIDCPFGLISVAISAWKPCSDPLYTNVIVSYILFYSNAKLTLEKPKGNEEWTIQRNW